MEARMPVYLHQPVQILWFDSTEFGFIVVLYLMATLFGGFMWIALFVLPCVVIPYKREKSRGFFQHVQYQYGYAAIKGYPLPTANEFYE